MMNGSHSLIQTYTKYTLIDTIPCYGEKPAKYDPLCTRELIVEGDLLVRNGLYVNSGSVGRVSFSLMRKLAEK